MTRLRFAPTLCVVPSRAALAAVRRRHCRRCGRNAMIEVGLLRDRRKINQPMAEDSATYDRAVRALVHRWRRAPYPPAKVLSRN